jgi:ligand-binding sensor domain-containing protein
MRNARRTVYLVIAGLAATAAGAIVLAPRDVDVVVHAEEAPAPRAVDSLADPWQAPDAYTSSVILYDRFETLGVADGLPSERVTAVVAEGDDLYVGTDDGLAIRRGGAWQVIGASEGLAHRYVTSIARDETTDTTWVSTLRGISRVSGGDVRNYTQLTSGLMNDVVYQVLVDGPLVWCGTAAGTSVLDTRSGSWTLYDHENSIMHEPWCYSVAVGPERGWIALWGGGIVEIDRRTGRWREYRDPDGEMEIDLLADDGPIHEVTSFISYDQGLLWQATYFGMARYDGRRWRSFTKADAGLPGDFVSHVAARGDACWIGSDEGLGILRGETCVSYERQDDGTCAVRIVADGEERETTKLATAPADDYVLWVHPRERDVWIATGRGLSHGTVSGHE